MSTKDSTSRRRSTASDELRSGSSFELAEMGPQSARALSPSLRDDVSEDLHDRGTITGYETKPNRCCNKDAITDFLKAIWATRNTKITRDKQRVIKTTLRDLIIYCVYLVLVMIIALLPTVYMKAHFFTDIVQQFTFPLNSSEGESFKAITSQEDMWTYIRGGMLTALYANGDGTSERGDREFHIETDNRLVGRPRIRQVRVRSADCAVPDCLKKRLRQCYPDFSAEFESTAKLEPKLGRHTTYSASAWTWSSVEEAGGGRIDGAITSYPGSGYVIDLSTEKNKTQAILDELFKGLWTSRATRAVIIDFTLYNANLNLFFIGQILFETPYTGGVVSSSIFRPLRLIHGDGATAKCVFICEIVTLAFVLYFIIEEALEIKRLGLAYFRKFWNLLDFTVVAFSLTCVILHCYGYVISHQLLSDGVRADGVYPEFVHVAYWCQQYNRMLALLVFFSMIKLFKFVSFSETMGQLTATLSYAIYDLAGFTIMFVIVFAAFVQAGYLMFGRSSAGFSTFSQTAFVLYRIILGDFDMEAIKAAHPVLGPLYFIIYVLFVFFVLLNMFLAIIGEAYSKVKERMEKRTNDFKLMGYLRQTVNNIMDKVTGKNRIPLDQVLASASMHDQTEVTFENWRRAMKRAGYSEIESSFLFNKYDKDCDRILNFLERRKMREDIATGAAFQPRVCDEEDEGEQTGAEAKMRPHDMEGDPTDLFADPDDCEELKDRIWEAEEGMQAVVQQICNIIGHMQQAERMRREAEKSILQPVL